MCCIVQYGYLLLREHRWCLFALLLLLPSLLIIPLDPQVSRDEPRQQGTGYQCSVNRLQMLRVKTSYQCSVNRLPMLRVETSYQCSVNRLQMLRVEWKPVTNAL